MRALAPYFLRPPTGVGVGSAGPLSFERGPVECNSRDTLEVDHIPKNTGERKREGKEIMDQFNAASAAASVPHDEVSSRA